MRFFAHDGISTHGPAGIDELLKLPGFDGDTLVCPVGSDDTSDWKPALAYPPFKKALLDAAVAAPAVAPAPVPVPASAPAPMLVSLAPMAAIAPLAPIDSPKAKPGPAEPPKAHQPCPRCSHANLETARFCNACGARMDGRPEDTPPSAPTDPPKANPPVAVPAPAAKQEPAFDPFAHLDPLRSFPAEPEPASLPDSPRRPLQPVKMGQLGALDEPSPAASAVSPSPALAPEPAPAAPAAPIWKRPAVLASFVGAAVVAAGLGYMMLNKSAPHEAVAELTPAPEPMASPQASPAPATPEAAPIYSAPPQTSSPAMPAPRARKPQAPAPKRARKPRPARAAKPAPSAEPAAAEAQGGGDALIESPATEAEPKAENRQASERDPLLEALLSDATQSAAEPAAEPVVKAAAKNPPAIGQRPAAKPRPFSLPGLQRPVSASDRANAPQASAPQAAAESAPTRIAGLDAAPLAEPGKSPPPGIENEPVKSAEGDQLALVQVHEQFDFCAQLLAQGAYGDHYDTCLCKDAREAAPYRGRRGLYVSAKKKDASAGRLETAAKILSSKIDGGAAAVTARWKSGGEDKGRTATQSWKLEDGLWCQAP